MLIEYKKKQLEQVCVLTTTVQKSTGRKFVLWLEKQFINGTQYLGFTKGFSDWSLYVTLRFRSFCNSLNKPMKLKNYVHWSRKFTPKHQQDLFRLCPPVRYAPPSYRARANT